MTSKKVIVLYVVVSLALIGVLFGYMFHYKNKCEKYKNTSDNYPPGAYTGYKSPFKHSTKCLCNAYGGKLCVDKKRLLDSYYEDGNTENQNFSSEQTNKGGPLWHPNDFSSY